MLNQYFSSILEDEEEGADEEVLGDDDIIDDLLIEDDYGFSDILDPNLHLELEQLKLARLKVREEQLQVKQRVILLRQAERRPRMPGLISNQGNRCILPDGTIVVRNNERVDSRDAEMFSAGAGDSNTLPGLQRMCCVYCNAVTNWVCDACTVTPYCSEPCQRRDWVNSHRDVCHNLARDISFMDGRRGSGRRGNSSRDNGFRDNGSRDNGSRDNGSRDNGSRDNSSRDNGSRNSGSRDNGSRDNGSRNSGSRNNGPRDNGSRDNGSRDNGSRDNGSRDNGSRDNGRRYNGLRDDGARDDGARFNGRRYTGPRDDGPRDDGARYNGPRDNGPRDNGPRDNGPRDNGPRDNGSRENVTRDEPRNSAPAPLRRPHASNQNRTESQPGDDFTEKSDSGARNTRNRLPDKYKKNGGQGRGGDQPRNRPLPNNDEDWLTTEATLPTRAPETVVSTLASVVKPNPAARATQPAAAPAAAPATRPAAAPTAAPAARPAAAPAARPAAVPVVAPAVQVASAAQAGGASVTDGMPVKKLVPPCYLLDKLIVGDTFGISVDAKASDCRQTCGDYICLTMHVSHEIEYNLLCEDYVVDCEKTTGSFKLVPGEMCSYFNVEDGGWYRARCLNMETLALIDASKLVTVSGNDKIIKLPSRYDKIPEFSAVLYSKVARIGMNLKCTITSTTQDVCKALMMDVDTDAVVGNGEFTRWLPTVDYPVPAASSMPKITRPPVKNGSNVMLVDVSALDKVYVRSTDAESQHQYNEILQEVVIAGMKSAPLTEPPMKGQTVIGKFTDGIHYRALCKRTNTAKNKYMLEYIEFGNVEVQKLEDIYPCPSALDLESLPTLVSEIVLTTTNTELTEPAKDLIEKYKDTCEELILTLPNNAPSAPSGAEASLTVAKNRQSFSKKLIDLCTPEWKLMEDNDQDILDVPCIMFDQVKFLELPANGCIVQVTDVSILLHGSICGYDSSLVGHEEIYVKLEKKIEEYVNSEIGKEPYLPRPEEVCIAKQPELNQWRRAVVLEQIGGSGGNSAQLLFFDYGATVVTPVADIRKMLPEFCVVPAMTVDIEIKDFPNPANAKQIELAKDFMGIDENKRGKLRVTSSKEKDFLCTCEAPELIEFLQEWD